MLTKRIASLSAAVALVTACHDDRDPPQTVDDQHDSDGGNDYPPATSNVLDDDNLEHAQWPADLDMVVVHATDSGVVVVAMNDAGQPIGRVSLDEVADSVDVVSVESRFADGGSWGVMDLAAGVVLSVGTDPLGETAHAEFAARVSAMIAMAEDQGPDPADPQAGPWLDCALSVLTAVVACIPTGSWVVTCPKAIVGAVCTCHGAAQTKKKKKKKKPAACEG